MQDDAECVNVGLRRDPLAKQLRGHVGQRTDIHHLRSISLAAHPVRRAKVANLGLVRAGKLQISGLDIAVNDAGTTSVIEGARAFVSDVNHFANRLQPVGSRKGFQRTKRQVFHCQIGAVFAEAGIKYFHDIGVMQIAG